MVKPYWKEIIRVLYSDVQVVTGPIDLLYSFSDPQEVYISQSHFLV